MIILDREMQVQKHTTQKEAQCLFCQASYNSDGMITLRNYNAENRNSDEIIILSKKETRAILDLIRQITGISNDPIPF